MADARRGSVATLAALAALVLVAAVGLGLWRAGSEAVPEPPPAAEASSATPGEVAGRCELPEDSQEAPTEGPPATWEVRQQVTVPSSPELGPALQEDGDRACFAHTPMGAVFAVLNVQGLEPEHQVRHIEGGDVAPEDLDAAPGTSDVLSVRGFRAEPQGRDRVEVTVVYAFGESGPLTAIPTTALWVDGDWKVDGTRLDRPSSRVSSLDGFVPWGPS